MNRVPAPRSMLAHLVRLALDANDDERTESAKVGLLGMLVGSMLILAVWGTIYAFLGEYVVASLYLAHAIGALAALALFVRGGLDYRILLNVQLALVIIVPLLVSLRLGGLGPSGSILWGFCAPLGALIVLGAREARVWFLAFMGSLIALTVLQPGLYPSEIVPFSALAVIRGLNILAVACFVFALMGFLLEQLRRERARADALLLNILPKEIAAALKTERRSIANLYPEVTILFADVVDFTPMSARMAPGDLIDLLDRVFSHFDMLVEREGLEKIKTIGDCYMVAAGVPTPRPDHAYVVAGIALDMLEYVQDETFKDGWTINLRIGMNSGPVVAGVIGRKKFLYDLWGDTVNTASRMETSGEPGRIQITRATYERIKDRFVCEPRGTISVKGKGEMEVWHLLARMTVRERMAFALAGMRAS